MLWQYMNLMLTDLSNSGNYDVGQRDKSPNSMAFYSEKIGKHLFHSHNGLNCLALYCFIGHGLSK